MRNRSFARKAKTPMPLSNHWNHKRDCKIENAFLPKSKNHSRSGSKLLDCLSNLVYHAKSQKTRTNKESFNIPSAWGLLLVVCKRDFADCKFLSLRTSDRRHWCGNPFSLAETKNLSPPLGDADCHASVRTGSQWHDWGAAALLIFSSIPVRTKFFWTPSTAGCFR